MENHPIAREAHAAAASAAHVELSLGVKGGYFLLEWKGIPGGDKWAWIGLFKV